MIKKNGKGKAYNWKSKLEFEGDFSYDEKWDGKGYDKNGNIIYELINGKGRAREYNDFGTLIYDGEYLNGKRHGKGKEYYAFDGGIQYEGDYLNGKRNGKGKEFDVVGLLIFEGEYLNNYRNGKGKEYFLGKFTSEVEYLNGKIKNKTI